jgi:hypothetical protein
MVLAISVLEAPLKFRAEGLELRVGMAIGRIMFRALNVAEVLWVVVIALCLSVTGPSGPVLVLAALTAVLLAVQLLLVRPRLNRRSARVRVGQDAPRSLVHHARVGDRRRGFPGAPSGVSVIFDGLPMHPRWLLAHRPARSTHPTSSVSSAGASGYPGHADRRQG